MLFNSIEFAIFLLIVFLHYWFVFYRNLKRQNFFIVVASYVFSGWWGCRFRVQFAFMSLFSYASGLAIEKYRDQNKNKKINVIGLGMGGHCISVDPWFLVGGYPSLPEVVDEPMKTSDGQPTIVLNPIYEIMKQNGIFDTRQVGLYGLTYKENVDDVRESPMLQLVECQECHFADPLKVYDPMIEKDIVKNQFYDSEAFLNDTDMVVVMVKHYQIKGCRDKLAGKVILDCHNICLLEGAYHI